MRDIGKKHQFIFCQLLFYIDAVTQAVKVTNDTESKVQGYD